MPVKIKFHKTADNKTIAEIVDKSFVINETQDAIDLMGDLVLNNCSRIIINKKNLHPDFFSLKTGLAGEILQKFSNYKVKLAIIGDFSKHKSKSLHDFIYESNKRNVIVFVDSIDSALSIIEK